MAKRATGRTVSPAEQASLESDGITITDIDGVTTCWIESSGPKRAMLQFRVGVADERFIDRGITHLVEHLSLTPFANIHEMYNGYVELGRTGFLTAGDQSHVESFLSQVAGLIHNLPVDRLEHEKRILRTEAQHRQPAAFDDIMWIRFGARTYGLSGYREFGLDHLEPDPIREWASSNFVAENAVLWLSFPPSDSLSFDLPAGALDPLPEPTFVERRYPTAIRWASTAAFSWLSPRSAAATMAEFSLTRRLQERLRHGAGASYSVASHMENIGADQGMSTVFVDSAEKSDQLVADTLHQVVAEFAETGHRDDDIAAWRHGYEQSNLHPDAPVGILDAMARRLLFGQSMISSQQWNDEVLALDPSETAAIVQEGMAEAIYVVPGGARLPGGIELFEQTTWDVVEGTSFSRAPHAKVSGAQPLLIVGSRGTSMVADEHQRTTVHWDDAVGLLKWSDGARVVVGSDASEVMVVPHRWKNGNEAASLIDTLGSGVPAITAGRRNRAPDLEGVKHWPVFGVGSVIAFALGLMWLLIGVGEILSDAPAEGETSPGDFVVLGAIVIGATLAVYLWKRWRAPDQLTWEYAPGHWTDTFPNDVPSTSAYIVGGLTLVWLAERDLVNEWFIEESGDVVGRVERREVKPTELYLEWDGALVSDMLTKRGNAFLAWYLRPRGSNKQDRLTGDLKAVMAEQGAKTWYHLDDDWPTYDSFRQRIDRRYRSWKLLFGWLSRV